MRISQIIEELETAKKEHGDLDVFQYGYDRFGDEYFEEVESPCYEVRVKDREKIIVWLG